WPPLSRWRKRNPLRPRRHRSASPSESAAPRRDAGIRREWWWQFSDLAAVAAFRAGVAAALFPVRPGAMRFQRDESSRLRVAGVGAWRGRAAGTAVTAGN